MNDLIFTLAILVLWIVREWHAYKYQRDVELYVSVLKLANENLHKKICELEGSKK